jgi:hypothetical protein
MNVRDVLYTEIRPKNGNSTIFRKVEKFLFLYSPQSQKPIKRKIIIEAANKRFWE